MNASFFWGVALGVAGVWAFHKWVRPIPGKTS